MGKLSITGKAEREVHYDAVELSVRFYVQGATTSEALKKALEQGEEFLRLITAAGVELGSIQMEDNSIGQRYNDKGQQTVTVSRKMTMRFGFNMAFINQITDMFRDRNYDVDFDTGYRLTEPGALHEALLKEALEDSHKKAEFIAAAMNQRVVGIDSVEYNGHEQMSLMCRKAAPAAYGAALSDRLQSPLTRESESIGVVWIIE